MAVLAVLLVAAAPAGAQDPSDAAASALALVIIILAVVLLSRTILPIYVFLDADKRNYNPVVWVVLVVLFGLIPFFIYLVLRPKTPLPRQGYYYYPAVYPGQPYAPPATYPGYAYPYSAPVPYPTSSYSPSAAPGSRAPKCRFCGVQGFPGDITCPNCGQKLY